MTVSKLKDVKPIVIPLKGNNQGLIALAHNQVFHLKTKTLISSIIISRIK